MKRQIFVLFFLLASAGCQSMDGDIYAVDKIQHKGAREVGSSTVVSYQTLMETLYFSPGVRVQVQGDDLLLAAVRCHIKNTCEVDVKATMEGPVSRVTVDSPNGRIYWYDGENKMTIEVAR